jgi:Tfp pilus assembly protein PilF
MDIELMVDLADAYDSAQMPDRAEREYENVLAIDANYADVRLKLARLLLMRGAADEARRHARAALAIQPNRQLLLDILHETERLPQSEQ